MLGNLLLAGLAAALKKAQKLEEQWKNASDEERVKILIALAAISGFSNFMEQNSMSNMRSDMVKGDLAGAAASCGIDPSFLR